MHKTLQLAAILLTAIAMSAGWAHLLEMPNKMGLSREDYLTVQQIYRGWALLGFAVVGALMASAALTFVERGSGATFRFALAGTVLVALTLVVFFGFTFPANQATRNWTSLPDDWEALRRQWEASHAVSAVLYLLALGALVASAVVGRR